MSGKKKPRVPKYPANPDALRIVTSFSRPMPEQSALEKYNQALAALERLRTTDDDKQAMTDMQLMGGAYNVALELLPAVGLGGNEAAERVIDAWGEVIVAICAELGIAAHGISPKSKGAKLSAEQFKAMTGWDSRCNQHERDAAMIAWPYKNSR